MMENFVIEFWYWWVAAAAFMALEILLPGIFFLWLGIAAGIVGIVALVIPSMTWPYQVALFAVLSVAAVLFARVYVKKRPVESDQPTLNRRGEQYVGRIVTLSDPIENGRGRAKIGDSAWSVEGDDQPAGAKVKIVGVDGIVLKVEPAA